jgi:hypothetical protein
MAHNTSNTFYFGSGEIRFSVIKNTFGLSETKASVFLKNTDVNNSNPGIPDATENSNILTSVSPGSNWKASHFRNSIKEYELFQYNTDTNVTLSSLTWNSNLSKNVKKRYKVTGKIGGTSSGGSALTIDGVIYNLEVRVTNGSYILGYGGLAGIKGSAQTTETVSSNVSAAIVVFDNKKVDPVVSLQTYGTGTATIKMYAGMRDYSNEDGRPWRYIYFGDDNGTQSVYVDPGNPGSSRERDFDINLAVTANRSYTILPTNLEKPLSRLVDYGTSSLEIPDGTYVDGFSMRDADNDICRGQVKINGITQGSYSRTIGSGSGSDAGHAINVNSSGNKVKIVEESSNSIRGGGGGGGAGKDGVAGTGGFCNTYNTATAQRTETTRCRRSNMDTARAAEICSGLGYSQSSRNNTGTCCERDPDRTVCVKKNKKGVCKREEIKRGQCIKWTTYVYCWNNYPTSGGSAGTGGNGGRGRGYNWNQLDGSNDKPITSPDYGQGGGPTGGGTGGGCGATNGTGGTRGGQGGRWNTAGTAGDTGSGGNAGQRILGSNWTS